MLLGPLLGPLRSALLPCRRPSRPLPPPPPWCAPGLRPQVGKASELVWANSDQGFVAVGVRRDEMVVRFYTAGGGLAPAHEVTILPDG